MLKKLLFLSFGFVMMSLPAMSAKKNNTGTLREQAKKIIVHIVKTKDGKEEKRERLFIPVSGEMTILNIKKILEEEEGIPVPCIKIYRVTNSRNEAPSLESITGKSLKNSLKIIKIMNKYGDRFVVPRLFIDPTTI